MSASIDQWIALLGAKPLPAFRSTKQQVLKLLEETNSNYPMLANIIRQDVGFSIQLLRSIGEHGNRLGEPITDISHAISLLGTDALHQVTADLHVLEELPMPIQQGLLACYSRALHAAHYATHWARARADSKPNESSAAGLLHELAEMALWAQENPAIVEIYNLMSHGSPRNDAAAEVLGISLDELSGELRRHWHLPELCGQLLAANTICERRLQCIKLTCALTHASAKNWHNEEILPPLEQLAILLETPTEEINATLHSLAVEVARDIYTLDLPCPAFKLPLPGVFKIKPESTAEKAPEKVQKAQPVIKGEETPAQISKPVATATKPEPPKTKPKATPQPAPADIKRPDIPPPKPINPMQDALSQAMKEMRDSLNLPRVAFIMLSKDRKHLQVRLVMEQEKEQTLRGIKTETGKGNIFGLLLNKPQAFWMNADNLVKYTYLVPKQLADDLGTRHFFVMPIFVKGKPIGLLYADGGIEEKGLSKYSFHQFKGICQRVNNTLKQ
jgi:HD-like signal output (HDOD) protein